MKSVALLVIIVVASFGYTQAPDTLWTKTYGSTGNDVGNSIRQTSDGGYIIAGSTESFGAGGQDVWLLKTDLNGDSVWAQTYGGADNDWAVDVQLTDDCGFMIAANTNSFGLGQQIWLIKTDSSGATTWTETYGDSRNETCYAVQQTSDGGFIIVGNTTGIFNGRVPLSLKINANGDTVWNTVIEWYPYGGSFIQSVIETFDSGFIVAGRCGLWLAKLDANGDTLWNKHYQGSTLTSVKHTPDSGLIACGYSNLQDYYRLCIIRTDIEGDTLWTRLYDDSLFQRWGNSGYWTNDNGYVITGGCGRQMWSEGDLLFLKTDNNGDSLWSVAYGDSGCWDEGRDILQTNDGGYIIVGYTGSYGAGGLDVWIIKTEPDIGVEENRPYIVANKETTATVFSGPLQLPEGKKCKVFDIMGRLVEPHKIQPGIYFIEVDRAVTQKVVKVR